MKYSKAKVYAIFLTFSVTSFFIINYVLHWPILAGKYLGAEPKFLDLNQTLNQIYCVEGTVKLGVTFSTAAEECRYVYSYPLFFILSWLKFTEQDILWVGIVLGTALVLIMSLFSFLVGMTTTSGRTFISFCLICSPPVMLLFERANIDIFIFILAMFSCYTLSRNWKVLTFMVLALCTIIKFYTLPVLWIMWIMMRSTSKKWTLLPLCLFSSFIFLDYSRTTRYSPYPTEAAFGNAILGKYLQSGMTNRMTDLLIGLVAVSFCWWLVNRYFMDHCKVLISQFSDSANRLLTSIFWVTSTIFIVCYLFTTNWDYRLVFLVVQILLLWPFISTAISFTIQILTKIIFVASIWLSYNAGIFQILGDIGVGIVFVINLVFWVLNFRNKTLFGKLRESV